MACPELRPVSNCGAKKNCNVHSPLDFISRVQTWISSWISSGATSLRVQDSSQRGFGGAAGAGAVLAPFCLSFEVKTFLKNGILRYGGEPRGGPVVITAGSGRYEVTQLCTVVRARDAAVVAQCNARNYTMPGK
jgi:hypothetical protein